MARLPEDERERKREGKRRRFTARNKRNLTWRSAHFLNGMFPSPPTDIMHCSWITGEKIAPRHPFSLSFRPGGKSARIINAEGSYDSPSSAVMSPPRFARAATIDTCGRDTLFVSCIIYRSVSQRYIFYAVFHVERLPSIASLSTSLFLYFSLIFSLSLFPSFSHTPEMTRAQSSFVHAYNSRCSCNLRFIIISKKKNTP